MSRIAQQAGEHDDIVVVEDPSPDARRGGVVDPVLSTLVRPLVGGYRTAEKTLARIPPNRIVGALPRTTGFAIRRLQRAPAAVAEGLPATRLTPSLLGWVALDEAIMGIALGPDRWPHRADWLRVRDEIAGARKLYRRKGWIADPVSFHREPPALPADEVRITTGWAHGLRYERLHWDSGYAPPKGDPGRERWQAYEHNAEASAWVLRHDDDRPRPWIVCVHGYMMGQPWMEFPAFKAAHLYHDLGCNVIGPTLPLHGPRKEGPRSGDHFLGFELLNSVHGMAQAVWDIRRMLSWVRAQTPEPSAIGMYGVSLGGYVTSLLAAVEPDLAAAIVGIPVIDLPGLFHVLCPPIVTKRAYELDILGGPAEEVHQVISPLAMPVVVPHRNRFLFAGLADRISRPVQAHQLWKHWGEPSVRWYAGNHIGFALSGKVQGFVDEVLVAQGLTRPRP